MPYSDRAVRWWRVGLVALGLVASVPASALADQVVSTALVNQFGASPSLTCFVSNVGKKQVTVKSVRFINEDGGVLGVGGSNCNFPGNIFPTLSCYQAAGSPFNGQFVRCEVVVKGSAKTLRVRLTSFDSTRDILESSLGQ